MLNNNSFELFLKLFDSQVQHIALYGAELWGVETKLFIQNVFRSWDANAKYLVYGNNNNDR